MAKQVIQELRYSIQQSALLGDKAEKTGIGGQKMYSQAEHINDGIGEQGGTRYVNPRTSLGNRFPSTTALSEMGTKWTMGVHPIARSLNKKVQN